MNTVAPWPSAKQAEARVLHVQTKLHMWAASDPLKQFGDLRNLVCDRATLLVAWRRVRANRGSRTAGIDGLTRSHVEQQIGVEHFLEDIRASLKTGTYRPQPVREVLIPKGGGKMRRLGIATVRDRVVQMALKLILEPIFEPDQYPSSYAYRPGRRAQDAVAEICQFINSGYEWVIEGDVEACFDNIQHMLVIEQVRTRISDRRVIRLCKTFLKAGVLRELGWVERQPTGTPQGGIVSPLFANLALTAFDRRYQAAWTQTTGYQRRRMRERGQPTSRLVRYSDDFVLLVMGTHQQAEALKEDAAQLLQKLGLTLSQQKTLVTHVDDGFEFLGFRILRRHRNHKPPCAYTFPTTENLRRTKRKVKTLTRRKTHTQPLEQVIKAINPVLRGVAYYYQHAAAKRALNHLNRFTWWRVARWLYKKHPERSWRWLKHHYQLNARISRGGVTLFNPATVPVTRYRYRGSKIATPWNTEQLAGYWGRFRQTIDERADLDFLQRKFIG